MANPEEDDMGLSKISQGYRHPQVKFEGVSSYKSQFIEPPKV